MSGWQTKNLTAIQLAVSKCAVCLTLDIPQPEFEAFTAYDGCINAVH